MTIPTVTVFENSKMARTVTYFASGSDREGEIFGLCDAGLDIGVAVNALHTAGLRALAQIAKSSTARLFVDSGAFGEVRFSAEGPYIHKLIDGAEWQKRIARYRDLVELFGARCYIVAPDCVAHQAETLERLERYAPEMRALRAMGAHILVAHQKGALTLPEFNAAAARALGFSDFVVAVPMCKDATSAAEVVELAAACKPARMHLLGKGPRSHGFEELAAAIAKASPRTALSCDSRLLGSLQARSGGKGGGARPITAAKDEAKEIALETMWSEGVEGADYTEALDAVEAWISRPGILRVLAAAELSDAETKEATRDFAEWLQEDERYSWPHIAWALDVEWSAFFIRCASVTWRTRRAIGQVIRKTSPSSITKTQPRFFVRALSQGEWQPQPEDDVSREKAWEYARTAAEVSERVEVYRLDPDPHGMTIERKVWEWKRKAA